MNSPWILVFLILIIGNVWLKSIAPLVPLPNGQFSSLDIINYHKCHKVGYSATYALIDNAIFLHGQTNWFYLLYKNDEIRNPFRIVVPQPPEMGEHSRATFLRIGDVIIVQELWLVVTSEVEPPKRKYGSRGGLSGRDCFSSNKTIVSVYLHGMRPWRLSSGEKLPQRWQNVKIKLKMILTVLANANSSWLGCEGDSVSPG